MVFHKKMFNYKVLLNVVYLPLLLCQYSLSQTYDIKLDGLRKSVEQVKTTQEKVDFLLEQCDYYRQRKVRNLDTVSFYAHTVLRLTKDQPKLETKKIDALVHLAYKSLYLDEADSLNYYLNTSKTLSQKLNYGIGLSHVSRIDAYESFHSGDNNMFVYNLEQAYKIGKKYKIPRYLLFTIAVDLTSVYISYNYNPDVVSNILLEFVDIVNDPNILPEDIGLFYLNLGFLYSFNKDSKNARLYFNKSIDVYSKNKNFESSLMYPMVNLASEYRDYGEFNKAINTFNKALTYEQRPFYNYIYSSLGDCYFQLEQYDIAKENYEKSLEESKADGTYLTESDIFIRLGEIYTIKNKNTKANTYFNLAISALEKFLEQKDFNDGGSYSYEQLSKIYKLKNNFAKSLEYHKLYAFYKDSLANVHNLEIAERHNFYKENLNNNSTIENLEIENEIKKSKAKQEKWLRISLVFLLVLFMLLLGIILNRYRLKQKTFKIIAEKGEESKLLMREIHHRVKTNLQIISNLLGRQIIKSKNDKELKLILKESQNKIKAMAIIHQNLFKGNQVEKVLVDDYTKELVEHIKSSFKKDNKDNKDVQFKLDIVSKEIEVGLAVPLGLIINELITNSYKYAFIGRKNTVDNSITIKFYQTGISSQYCLVVEDNGRGLPENHDVKNLSSFGIQLVYGLTEQLNGEVKVTQHEGTSYTILLEEPIAA